MFWFISVNVSNSVCAASESQCPVAHLPEEVWIICKCTGTCTPLLLSAGHLIRILILNLLDSQNAKQLPAPFLNLLFAAPVQRHNEHDIFFQRERIQQIVFLKDKPKAVFYGIPKAVLPPVL